MDATTPTSVDPGPDTETPVYNLAPTEMLTRKITDLAVTSDAEFGSPNWATRCAYMLCNAKAVCHLAPKKDTLMLQSAADFLMAVFFTCTTSVQKHLLQLNNTLQFLPPEIHLRLEHVYTLAIYNQLKIEFKSELKRVSRNSEKPLVFHYVATAQQLLDMVTAIQAKWPNNDLKLHCDTTYYEQVIAQLQAE
jgi:hypothetical protein